MKKAVKWVLAIGTVVFVCIQFVGPKIPSDPPAPNGDLIKVASPPPEVAQLLRDACYDCHSDETVFPWYSHVAPVSWFLASHINEAREDLNFSDWPDDPALERGAFKHIVHQVETGKMPLPSYTWMHPKARLTPEQRQQIEAWATNAAAAVKN